MKKTIVTLVVIFLIIMLLPLSLYVKKVNGEKIVGEFKQIYRNTEKSLVYISSVNCQYCQKFDPVIDEVSKEYNFKYIYIDITSITEKQYKTILNELNINENNFGTPYLVIGSNGEKVDENIGYLSKPELTKFLEEGNFIQK